jgi:hypothetical protein
MLANESYGAVGLVNTNSRVLVSDRFLQRHCSESP